ncbi:MAG: sensor domain-containing diguanylate cyclase [Acidimicrobiales bacterium]
MSAPTLPSERRRVGALYALGLLDSGPDPAFDEVTRLAQRLFHTKVALVSLVDSERQWFKSHQGTTRTETPRDQAFCAHAIAGDDDVFYVENALDDPRFRDNPLVTADPSIRFYAGAPVHTPDGHRLGTLCVIDDEPRTADAADFEALGDLAAIINREIAQAVVAVTDTLTGIHNRRGFDTAGRYLLDLADRLDEPVVFLYADVDNLKSLNDTDGHAAGDEALRNAASLLRDQLREADIVARVGGDEFAALLKGASAADIDAPLDRVADAIAEHNRLHRSAPPVSLSIGWVERRKGESFEHCVERADRAMYLRKPA